LSDRVHRRRHEPTPRGQFDQRLLRDRLLIAASHRTGAVGFVPVPWLVNDE
jgi:hypothetical protein